MGYPANDSTYYVSRTAYRLNDLLRIGSILAGETGAVARHSLSSGNQVAYELLVVVTISSLAATFLLLPRFLAPSATHRILPGSVTALFAVPLSYFCVLRPTWNWPALYDLALSWQSDLWRNTRLWVFAGEVLCVGTLVAMSKKRRIPIWSVSVLLVVHYAFCAFVLWPNFGIYFCWLYAPRVLFLTFPAAVIVWFLYLKGEEASFSATDDHEKARRPGSRLPPGRSP